MTYSDVVVVTIWIFVQIAAMDDVLQRWTK